MVTITRTRTKKKGWSILGCCTTLMLHHRCAWAVRLEPWTVRPRRRCGSVRVKAASSRVCRLGPAVHRGHGRKYSYNSCLHVLLHTVYILRVYYIPSATRMEKEAKQTPCTVCITSPCLLPQSTTYRPLPPSISIHLCYAVVSFVAHSTSTIQYVATESNHGRILDSARLLYE